MISNGITPITQEQILPQKTLKTLTVLPQQPDNEQIKFLSQPKTDVLSFQGKTSPSENQGETKKVSALRVIFRLIPQSTIDQINESGKLPENMMIVANSYNPGQYSLAWRNPITHGKILGGTQTLPATVELRKNLLGFTCVVPKNYEHFLLKNP